MKRRKVFVTARRKTLQIKHNVNEFRRGANFLKRIDNFTLDPGTRNSLFALNDITASPRY